MVQTDAKHSLLPKHGRNDFVVVTRHSIHLQDHVFAAYSRRVRDAVPLDACDGHVRFHRDAESLVVHRAHEFDVKCIRKSSAVDENRFAGRDGGSTKGTASVVTQHLMRAPGTHAMPALELRLRNGVKTHGTLLHFFLCLVPDVHGNFNSMVKIQMPRRRSPSRTRSRRSSRRSPRRSLRRSPRRSPSRRSPRRRTRRTY